MESKKVLLPILNLFLIAILQLVILPIRYQHPLALPLHLQRNESQQETFWICSLSLFFSFLVCDGIAYWFHFFLHKNKFLFTHIHSIHHEQNDPTFISTIYMHPLEMIPFYLIYKLPFLIGVRCNYVTSAVYEIVLIFITFMDHGVRFGMFKKHVDHHRYQIGNYATCIPYFDSFFRTEI